MNCLRPDGTFPPDANSVSKQIIIGWFERLRIGCNNGHRNLHYSPNGIDVRQHEVIDFIRTCDTLIRNRLSTSSERWPLLCKFYPPTRNVWWRSSVLIYPPLYAHFSTAISECRTADALRLLVFLFQYCLLVRASLDNCFGSHKIEAIDLCYICNGKSSLSHRNEMAL